MNDNEICVTAVKIVRAFNEGTLKAICSITINNSIVIHDIKIIYVNDKIIVVMPSKKKPDGAIVDVVHPITKTARAEIERKTISELKQKNVSFGY